MENLLNLELPIYYQSKSRFNGNPVQVIIVNHNHIFAVVKTTGCDISTTFKCKLTSLYNA
jgi:hypothetical protein